MAQADRKGINAGSIRNPATQAGRLVRYLWARKGQWIDGWTINEVVRSSALHTTVSEARAQLKPGWVIQQRYRGRSERGKRISQYRIATPRILAAEGLEAVGNGKDVRPRHAGTGGQRSLF